MTKGKGIGITNKFAMPLGMKYSWLTFSTLWRSWKVPFKETVSEMKRGQSSLLHCPFQNFLRMLRLQRVCETQEAAVWLARLSHISDGCPRSLALISLLTDPEPWGENVTPTDVPFACEQSMSHIPCTLTSWQFLCQPPSCAHRGRSTELWQWN